MTRPAPNMDRPTGGKAAVKLTSFSFDPELSAAFVRFCAALYRDDPHWIAPIEATYLRQFDPDFHFYKQSENRHQHFIARIGERVVGHASAFVNSALRDRDGATVGAIGFFECTEDYAVAEALLAAAAGWLRKRGRELLWGPVNFDIWHGYRMMTQGFERAPFFGEPYNKPYYPAFFERFGFAVRHQWTTIEIESRGELRAILAHSEDKYRQAVAEGYRFRAIDPASPGDVDDFHCTEMRSFERFLGYTPFAPDAFRRLFEGYLRIIDPRFVSLVYDGDGRVAGFSVAYPDIADALRVMGGRSNLIARLRFLHRRKRSNRAVYYMVGTTPEETAKRRGLGRAAVHHTLKQLCDAGYENVIFALITDERISQSLMGAGSEAAQRAYALYELTP